jgi:hypothetical protein
LKTSAMERLKKRFEEKFSVFYDTKDIYKLEKLLMRKMDMWPGDDLINKKLISFFLFSILVINIPQIIFLSRNSFLESMFEYSHGLVEFIYVIHFDICFLVILWKRHAIKPLLNDFEEFWKSCKFS